jgi:hypothetical protein
MGRKTRGRGFALGPRQAVYSVTDVVRDHRGLSEALRQLRADHGIEGRPSSDDAFVLTDGHRIQFADSPNKTCELVSNFSRPIVCLNVSSCLERIEKERLLRY